MQRTTIFLDPALKRRLQAAARRSKRTEAALIREALDQYLSRGRGKARVRAVGRSRDGGIADRVDEVLAATGFGRR